ncbi:hypothetical protein JDV02_004803 [Purpureocillium takamizusanense]|uniref:Tat pathway signal sequence n=1 Tax=Purpureocillium takamizusanense TaxID=2060973 RepID=A0A9Q8QF95_9HYPO|nr:uncharacterized protein JDV02_004803 [Purpureocillium takamizusanense]UNI18540.1 hypothetical protein JDV02_004803 [Purpureocillium takamizusanense]
MGLLREREQSQPSHEMYEALLSESDADIQKVQLLQRHSRRCKTFIWLSCFTNVLFAAGIISLLVRQGTIDPSLYDAAHWPGSYSPAEEAVKYVPRQFLAAFGKETSPYQGWPTDEQDQMWEDMYIYGTTFQIDQKEHDRLINKTEHVAIPGLEDKYMTGLDVFHQLHCLNMIRQNLYPKRYNSSIVREDGTIDYPKWRHVDHCIESIRQSITCNVDISMIRYKWSSYDMIEPQLGVMHMCRDFDRIRDWAYQRYVDPGNRRQHVENGRIVDYSEAGTSFEDNAADYAPKGWDKTINDL